MIGKKSNKKRDTQHIKRIGRMLYAECLFSLFHYGYERVELDNEVQNDGSS